MKKRKAFNPKKSFESKPLIYKLSQEIEVNLWSISMTAKTGEEIKIIGSSESEAHCWRLFANWKKSNSHSTFWNWSIEPKLRKQSYLKVVRN